MVKKYNKLSLFYGVPGFLLQGLIIVPYPVFRILGLLGLVLFIIGLSYYAKSIGRHPTWGFLGLLSWFGIIIILCLKDKTLTPTEKLARKRTKAKDVILGILLGLGLVMGVPIIIVMLFKLFIK